MGIYLFFETRKMFLSLYWLLVAIAYQTEGHVGNDFSKCSEFFFKHKMPVGFEGIAKSHDFKEIPDGITNISDLASPAYICQTYGGKSHYATLYDRGRHIPLYSAYILDRKSTDRTPGYKHGKVFRLEPQLIYRELTQDMQLSKDTSNLIKAYNKHNKISEKMRKNQPSSLMKTSQAVDADYSKERFNKGHLNPCGHHMEHENYISTFTLTNVVPMLPEVNGGVWSQYEKNMTVISSDCSKMYVVTGSIPGNNALSNNVTIPSYVWNAYCCLDKHGKPIKSGGAIVANDKALTANKFEVHEMKLKDLQIQLQDHLKVSKNIEIFVCDCQA